ncbi:hypothetical protein [Mycobacterium sp. GA-2829]|uniref:hypothetical protein n=1 Tax=Mycobacterium sp. GA-2829 TaxID=1772283 RepID=UPI0018D245A6
MRLSGESDFPIRVRGRRRAGSLGARCPHPTSSPAEMTLSLLSRCLITYDNQTLASAPAPPTYAQKQSTEWSAHR